MQKVDQGLWKSEGLGHWLVVGWQDALRQVLDTLASPDAMSGVRLQARFPELGAWMSWPSPTWCRLALEAIPGAAISVGCPQQTVQMLGRLIAGDPELADPDCRETFLELINQSASATGDVISGRMGKRVQFSSAQIGQLPEALDYAVQIEFLSNGEPHALAFVANAPLLDALDAGPPPKEVAAAPPAPAAPAGALGFPPGAFPPTSPGYMPPPILPSGNLDLLLEVELPVCVTFGRTQLPLKDVLKLSSGSIVELNRLANEPVEVLINNSVIARGEVVVVEGNYGIRVTEIVSRQERIRSIF